ncbi:MAG: histidinol-phosphatase [Termitinemataceae bacterium]|nr:MAG: histidinol-phosphatase [Termitinemataceae bacterium]
MMYHNASHIAKQCQSLHVHTDYCDGHGSVADYCNAAFNKGFSAIGFSAHAPLKPEYGIASESNMKNEDFPKYVADIMEAKKKWSEKFDVFLGLEADHIEADRIYVSPLDWDIKTNKLDYILGSVHFVTKTRCVDACVNEFDQLVKEDFNGDCYALIKKYYTNIEHMLNLGGFDILSHVDLIKKFNSNNQFFDENDDLYKKQIASIVETISDLKIVTEVNTGGMNRGWTKEPYPSKYFLSMLNKNHVPVILNSDAHKPEHLDGSYKEARSFLIEAGYSKIVAFKGRDSGSNAIWKEESIL